jgi:hypothetical protein
MEIKYLPKSPDIFILLKGALLSKAIKLMKFTINKTE